MATDTGRWGHSLGNLAEIWMPCLDAAGPGTLIEVGAYAGDVTRLLVEWAQGTGGRIFSIDPDPQPQLVRLAEESGVVELVRSTSLEALPGLPAGDGGIIGGAHKHRTVSEEMRMI